MQKGFDCEPVYYDKYIKVKIKSYGYTRNTSFQDKKIPKDNVHCSCLSVILLEFVIKVGKKYYLETHSEEFKNEIKKQNKEFY